MEQCHVNQDFVWMSRDAGSLHAGPVPATSAPPLNTRCLHCVTGHVTACFLSLFVLLSACLRLVLCINVLLFSLSQPFISFTPFPLSIYFHSRFQSLLPTVSLSPSIPSFSIICILSLLLSFYVYFLHACNFFFISCSFISPIFDLITFCSRDSSVSTVTGLRARRPRNGCSIPGGWCFVCLSYRPDHRTSRCPHNCDPTATGESSSYVKAAKARHWPRLVTTLWMSGSVPPHRAVLHGGFFTDEHKRLCFSCYDRPWQLPVSKYRCFMMFFFFIFLFLSFFSFLFFPLKFRFFLTFFAFVFLFVRFFFCRFYCMLFLYSSSPRAPRPPPPPPAPGCFGFLSFCCQLHIL